MRKTKEKKATKACQPIAKQEKTKEPESALAHKKRFQQILDDAVLGIKKK